LRNGWLVAFLKKEEFMSCNKILKRAFPIVVLVILVSSFLILFPIGEKNNTVNARGAKRIITGTGTIVSSVYRCFKVFEDVNAVNCAGTDVQLIFRETTLDRCDDPDVTRPPPDPVEPGVAFTGLIQNPLNKGHQFTRAVRDNCSTGFPPQGTAKVTYTLDEVTIMDEATGESWTGGLELEGNYIFDGDATSPSGSRARVDRLLITRGFGQLAGTTGELQYVTPKATSGAATSFYYAEIRVPQL